jgi:hypothetical protein
MAVNDKNLTMSVEEAKKYFEEKYGEGSKDNRVRIDNGMAVAAAAYSANFVRNFKGNYEDLVKKGAYIPGAVAVGQSSGHVDAMVFSYGTGNRIFDLDFVEQARRVCESALSIVKVIEGKTV